MKHATTRTSFAVRPLALEIASMFRPSVAAAAVLAMPLAFAAPQGGAVVAGQATIQQNGSATTVTQGSQRAAVNWQSFNVGQAETVNFIQPNASSAILNRVVGNDASAIFGRITANGQVYLVNPNGIVFGRTAQVDVGALAASTSNISNADFMAARLAFTEAGKPGARVENQGSITVGEGGFAALVGRNVANSGTITARLGKVALAGGDAFVLDLYGDKLVNLIVDPAAMGVLTDAGGNPLAASVDHSGLIVAEGGRVQLSAATVKQLVDNLINVSGVVRATSFATAPGVISLRGDANTLVVVSGRLDTSGEHGGRIEVTGRDVSLQTGAVLASTGGSIAVGGDWQGQGPLAHADQVSIASGALIDASAGAQGQGGTVAVWSDGHTQFYGRIEARGGSAGGDGGQVEVSSKGQLGFQGDVNVGAVNGLQGSLLLDPANLRIGAVSSGDSEISADQLRFFLTRGTNVALAADQNIVVDAEVNALVAGGGGVRGGGLSLSAGNNLTVNHTIALNDGALTLTATGGTLSQADNTALFTGSGAATLRGGAGVNLGQVLSGGAVDIRSANGTVNVRNAIVSATSNGSAAPVASLYVESAGAVSLNGALVQGNATVRSRDAGVSLASAVLQSREGHVLVTAGTDITSSAANVGLVSGRTASATAHGSIDLGTVIATESASLTADTGSVSVRQAITGEGSSQSGRASVVAGGAVALAGVNAGSNGIQISAGGNVTSQGSSASEGGLLSSGGVVIETTGRAGTAAAPLNVMAMSGDVRIDGAAGVDVSTLLARGAIRLDAGAGSVTVRRSIAAEAGAIGEGTASRPTEVQVSGRDGVDLAGAVVGSGGLSVNSAGGAVNLHDSSIFSSGIVNIQGRSSVTLGDGAGIATTTDAGLVTITAQEGELRVGSGGIRASGAGVNITLNSMGTMALNGDVQTPSGTIHLVSQSGSVIAQASATAVDATLNATLDAGRDATRSSIVVSAQGDIELGELIAQNWVSLWSVAGNVTLKRGLGGNASGTFGGNPVLLNTGYVDYSSGYQAQYRPNVGRVVISALQGSVELNGLNLDGNASPTDTAAGLSVTAGQRIVSNNEIAVSKGKIELFGGSAQPTDGVYLGSSVYSRGFDSVGADGVRGGGDDQKIGYGINIRGRVLGLFDNTAERARLPINTFSVSWAEGVTARQAFVDAQGFLVDATGVRLKAQDGSFQVVGYPADTSPGGSPSANAMRVFTVNAQAQLPSGVQILTVQGLPVISQQEIAKIEVANNVANYQDHGSVDNRGVLVPATLALAGQNRVVAIDSQTIARVGNSSPGIPLRIASFVPQLTTLRETLVPPVVSDPDVLVATAGIGLKLLGFEESGDTSSSIWASTLQLIGGINGAFFGLPGGVTGTVPVHGTFTVVYAGQATRSYSTGGVVTNDRVLTSTGQGGFVNYRFEFVPGSSQQVRLADVDLSGTSTATLPALPAGATLLSDWVITGLRSKDEVAGFRMVSPVLTVAGAAGGVQLSSSLYPSVAATPALSTLQPNGVLAPAFHLLTPDFVQDSNGGVTRINPTGSFYTQGYQLQNVLVDSTTTSAVLPASAPGTRVFVYDGVINAANGSHVTDYNSGTAIPPLSGIAGFNNSTVGFAGVGVGFGSLAGGTTGSAGAGGASGQAAGGAGIPGAQNGGGAVPPFDDRSAQDAAGSGPTDNAAAGQPGAAEVFFSARASAQADLGRGAAVPGSAVNVFKRRYQLATSSLSTVCAPEALQTAKPADSKTERDCPAAR